MTSEISNRKKEHLDLAADPASEAGISPGWQDVHLVPSSFPAIGPDEVDLRTSLAGHVLEAPFVIASMTGGHADAAPINESLAAAAETLGIAIGSGSQRAALRDDRLTSTYTIIRETAPKAVVMANVGICQLVDQANEEALERDDIDAAIEMLDAQFLIVHLNIVEELIQPEGDKNMGGLLDALQRVVEWSPVPVVAKETGSGMSRRTAELLSAAGASVLDVGGAGGTSFARIEGRRAASQGDGLRARLGTAFSDWGVPTAASVRETAEIGLPVIATGGVRNGLDAAKAVALGANAVGVGRPALTAALDGPDAAIAEMSAFIEETKLAVVLTGNRNLGELQETEVVITGMTREWQMRDRK